MKFLELYFRKVFTVDLRALAIMRIWLAGIILTDLAIRASDMEAHYSNRGVLPLHVLHEYVWLPHFFSLHVLSGLWQFQAILFFIAGVSAICLMLGYKTRLSTVFSWVLLVSLQNRNLLIGQGGDDLLRMLLFWGMFLPLGKFYSYDATKATNTAIPDKETKYFSAATVAYILQIFLLYFCTALLKNSPEWNVEGTALYYALSLDQILMPVGKLIYPYPELLRFLTLTTFYTELLLPFLLLIPFYNTFFRIVVVSVLLLFHIGISLTLFVGLFYLINVASIAGLLPPKAMDWIESKFLSSFRGFSTRSFQQITQRYKSPFSFKIQYQEHRPILKRRLQSIVKNSFVTVMLVYCIWWNFSGLVSSVPALPQNAKWLGYLLRTDQHWGMFAPVVFKDDGWYILEGYTAQGKIIDLNQQGKEANYTKPASVVSLFKNDRWRKYSENYLFVNNTFMRPYYCNYLMRRWNEANPEDPIQKLEVIYMMETSLPNYEIPEPKRELLCNCGKLP